ncbi:hypothetical protein ACFQFH_06805 [Halobaculum halobium]|uniref:hypothetical protein n=1 Tax=Halobaculum halobium TaxID=3032281 RepID=UPI0036072C08
MGEQRTNRIVALVGDKGVLAAAKGAGRGLATALLIIVVVWNAAALGYVEAPSTEVVEISPEETRWDMFAPSPPTEDVWYVAVGTLDSGERVNVIHGGDPEMNRSDRQWGAYPSARWRKYLEVVRWSGDDELRRQFALGLCARWNATHSTHVESLTVRVLSQPTRPNATEPTQLSSARTFGC